MKIDLHVHTEISDGFLSIEDTLKSAKEKNLDCIAITDHDTLDGIIPAMSIASKLGLSVIPGVEISAMDQASGVKVHILGYFMNLPAKNIEQLCQPITNARHHKSLEQIKALQSAGYNISEAEILSKRKGRPIYKQHIMLELIKQGYTDKIYSDLYKKLFKNGGICHSDIQYATPEDAIKAIKADGGIAVLAHPGHDNNFFLLERLVSAGLDGIELIHDKHTTENMETIEKLASQYQLMLTGGSDYHGEAINSAWGNLICPNSTTNFFATHDNPLMLMHELVTQSHKKIKELIIQEDLNIEYKQDRFDNIVTNIDVQLEQFLVAQIQQKFPQHGFVTEEHTVPEQTNSEYTWIIDPIDGTTNFVCFQENYAVSIALYKNALPYAGIVYDVAKQDIYFAVEGYGAWFNSSPIILPLTKTSLHNTVLDLSLRTVIDLEQSGCNTTTLAKKIRGHRAYGCASLGVCKIAIGEPRAYVSTGVKLWDYAAAGIVLRESGGSFSYTQLSDSCQVFCAAANEGILVSLKECIGYNRAINQYE